jgi:histidine ammonia-lyase
VVEYQITPGFSAVDETAFDSTMAPRMRDVSRGSRLFRFHRDRAMDSDLSLRSDPDVSGVCVTARYRGSVQGSESLDLLCCLDILFDTCFIV